MSYILFFTKYFYFILYIIPIIAYSYEILPSNYSYLESVPDLLALTEKSPTIGYKGGVHPVFHLQGSLELTKISRKPITKHVADIIQIDSEER